MRERNWQEKWAEYQRSKARPLKPGKQWRFTHRLEIDRKQRWRCACGYQLGDGRQQFLARCSLYKEDEAYSKNRLSLGTHAKKKQKTAPSQRQASARTGKVSTETTDLFRLE
jgi:hypothetical protein